MEVSQLREPITLTPWKHPPPPVTTESVAGGDSGASPDVSAKRKPHYHLPAIELFVGRPDRSLVTTLSYPGS